MIRSLLLASILGFATLAHAAPPAKPKKQVATQPMSADSVMAVGVLSTPFRRDQEAMLVKLIEDTPDSAVADKTDLLFRLGELQAKQHRLFRLQTIELDMKGDKTGATKAGEQAKQYLLRSVKTYKALTDNPAFSSFTKMDLALFYYAYTLQSAKYLTEARAVYDKLLKNYPASPYVPEAHLAFAEHYFEEGKLEDAEARYERVLKFPKSSVYWYAMYKLGWIQLNRTKYQEALDTFFQIAQATEKMKGQQLLHKSAKHDFVRAYAEIGKVDKALMAFKRVDAAGSLGMLERLADHYVEQGKSDKAIYALRELMKLSPKSANVCMWQQQIAHVTLSLPGATLSDKVREVADLTRLYQALVPTKILPAEAGSECREHAETMAYDLSRAYHSEWSKTKSTESFAAAKQLYNVYLGAFSDAQEFHRMRYFSAELMWSHAEVERDARLKTEQWEQTARAFMEVVKAGKIEPKLLNEAAYAAVRAWLYAHESDPRVKPQLANASKAEDAAPTPKPLPERERNMLESVDLYVTRTSKPPEDELVRMKLMKANVLRRFDHLAEAIPLFRDIIAKHPDHESIEDAALLLVDSLVRLATTEKAEADLIATVDQLLANKKLLAGKETLQTHLDKIKATSLARAAEGIEKRARATKSLAQLVKCGEAYVAIYNRQPDAETNDTILWNAGVCYEDGRSIDAALRMYTLLQRYYPKSKLAARATARIAKANADIAFYREAAQAFEQYAKKYGGEADAYDAMSNAVFFQKGIGDDAKAIENTRYFVKTFGGKKPVEAANAAFSLTAIYEKQGDVDATVRHLREYVRVHGSKGGQAKLVIAHAKIGQLLYKKSCPVAEVDGSCIKVTRERAVANRARKSQVSTQCGEESKLKVTVVRRDERLLREAMQHFALASKEYGKVTPETPDALTARHYHAQAKLADAGLELEAYLALAFPANLDFDPKQPALAKKSLARFDAWFMQKEAGAKKTSEKLGAVLQIKDPASSIAAAARLGQVTQNFSDALFTAEIPKDVRSGPYAEDKVEAYCDVLTTKAIPLADRSLEAYGVCLQKSTELGWFSEWSKLCERELGQIKPETYPTASERRGDADRVAVVVVVEKIPTLD